MICHKFSFVLRPDEGKYHWPKSDVTEIKVDSLQAQLACPKFSQQMQKHEFTRSSYRQNGRVSCTCESVGLLIENCKPRISWTEFVVLVGGKSEPFISCIHLCQVPCTALKTRRVKVKRNSSAWFKYYLPTSVLFSRLNSNGQKNSEIHDSVADEELAVDHQEGRQKEQEATGVKRKRTLSRKTLFSSSRTDNYIMLVINLVGDCLMELSLLNVDDF